MQANLLNSILTPQKAESGVGNLLGEKKIDSGEAELFAKLLQGSIDTAAADSKEAEIKSLFASKENKLPQGLFDSEKVDSDNVINLFGNNEMVLSQAGNAETMNIIASNPKLVEIFEKSNRPDELIVRLRDIMVRDPQVAKDVKDLLAKVEKNNEQANEILKLGKEISTDAKSEIQMPMASKFNSARINSYGQTQNAISSNIITPKKFNHTKAVEESHVDDKSEMIDRLLGRADSSKPISIHHNTPAVTATGKVLDLSSIPSSNTNEIINKISEYVQQSNFQNRQSLDLTVRHDDLGQFRINVNKMASSDQIDLKIHTSGHEAKLFFNQHEQRLIHSLEMSGIKVADIKILAGAESQRTDADSRGSNTDSGQNRNFAGNQQQQNRGGYEGDSQRRRELWEMYKERKAA